MSMPLYLAESNKELCVSHITGSDTVKRHLADMGFVDGQTIMIVTAIDDNIIVKVKGVSIALSHELAKRIYV